MSGGYSSPPVPQPDLAGLDSGAEPSNQEAVVLPYVAGEYTIAAHWLTPAYNQRAVEAPSNRPGKK